MGQMGRAGRPPKDLAAIAERAAQLSDSQKLAERLDRIASAMLDKLEKSISDFKPANLPLAVAIMLDKAGQARGSAMAAGGHTTVNVQINGLDKAGLRAALAGVGDIARPRSKAGKVMEVEASEGKGRKGRQGMSLAVETGSQLAGDKAASGEISPIEPGLGEYTQQPVSGTVTKNQPFKSPPDQIIELQQVTPHSTALHGLVNGPQALADTRNETGGEGGGDQAGGRDCINQPPVINLAKNDPNQPLPPHDSH